MDRRSFFRAAAGVLLAPVVAPLLPPPKRAIALLGDQHEKITALATAYGMGKTQVIDMFLTDYQGRKWAIVWGVVRGKYELIAAKRLPITPFQVLPLLAELDQ